VWFVVCFLVITLVILLAATRSTPRRPTPPGYFNDEFSAAELSPQWTREEGPGYGIETFRTDRDLVKSDGEGHLVVSAKRAADGSWRGGMVSSRKSFTMSSGVVEIRAKLPTSQGAWPALWLINALQGQLHTEIDIAESVSNFKTIYQTIHDWSVEPKRGWGKETPLTGGWHTYTLTWTPSSIEFGLDGESTGKFTAQEIKPWVWDKPLFIVLDVAVGGSWAGDPDGTTPESVEMLVDYVRVRPIGTSKA
jgi:beta-glucanase (GH16 family)